MASTIPVPLLDTQDSRSWWFVLGGKIGCSGFYRQKSQNTLSYFPGKTWAYLGHLQDQLMEDLRVLFQPDREVRSTPLGEVGLASTWLQEVWNCSILTPLTHFLFHFWPSTGVFKTAILWPVEHQNTRGTPWGRRPTATTYSQLSRSSRDL